jgi:hypothetical protein
LLYCSILKTSDESSMTSIASDVVYEWMFNISIESVYCIRVYSIQVIIDNVVYKKPKLKFEGAEALSRLVYLCEMQSTGHTVVEHPAEETLPAHLSLLVWYAFFKHLVGSVLKLLK